VVVPPQVVSVTPKDGASVVEPNATITIVFSAALDPKTVTTKTVRLLDGTRVVAGKVSYSDGKVTFVPNAPLRLLTSYRVSVGSPGTDRGGTPLAPPLSASFEVRDGAWHTIDAVSDKISGLADSLPMLASGEVLLSWNGAGGGYCPVSARWFLRGAASGA